MNCKCRMFPKPKIKKHSRKKLHDFSQAVKQKEYEDAGGICRTCGAEPITQYHHINEKGMGGGKGLGIQINCLGVGDRCHNHDNTEFLEKADKILEQRIYKLFNHSEIYGDYELIEILEIDYSELYRQRTKGFLKEWVVPGTYHIENIKRWLGVA